MAAAETNTGLPQDRATLVRVVILSFLIVMVDGYDTLMVSFVAPLLAHALHLQPTNIGQLFAAGYFGAIVGAVSMGPLSDRYGRKPMLVGSLLLATAMTFACSLAVTFHQLAGLRFLAGIGLGGALPAVISLTAEHAGHDRRAGTVTLMYIGYPLGAVVGGALTAGVLHAGWPTVFVCAGVACLLATVAALAIPESFKGKAVARAPGRDRNFLRAPLSEGRLWPAVCLWVGLFCLLMLTYALVSWTPSLVVSRGGTPQLAALAGVALNLGGITGALFSIPLINRFGPFLPIAFMTLLGSCFVALIGAPLPSEPFIFGVLFLAGFCVLGAQINFPAMMVDLFPPPVRGAGSGIGMAVGRFGSIVGPLLGGALVAAKVPESRLFLAAAVPAVLAALAMFSAAWLRRANGPGSRAPE
ncbi:MAG: MFS transporter [Candidatus Sphingomonas phytovorans]|nr:MFS transporter [Sphingomonas sp.]WEK02316.1 MAG: MFS transporter [Sphingomonas sp.]